MHVSSNLRMHDGDRSLKSRLSLESSAVTLRLVTAGVVMGLIVMRESGVSPSV